MLIRNKVREQKLLVCRVIIVCFSESLHLHVCLLSDPGGGTNVSLRPLRQAEGRGDSATDTED